VPPPLLSLVVRPMNRHALVALALLVLVGCESNAADTRLRRYLRIEPATPLTEVEIRAAVLRLVPVGSGEDHVRRTVAEAGIGSDGLSSYYPPDADGIAHIIVRFDPSTFGIVKREYSLALHFSRDRRLQDVQAKTWLTGP
jgi:hypothetical protein